MKKRNRILALILAAAVSMSMAACGKSGADSETSTDAGVEADAGADSDAAAEDAEEPAEQEEADPFAAAQENMKEITSLDASTVMEMDMVVGANGEEQSLESVTTMAMSCIYDPLQMSMDVTVDAGEAGSMTTTMYVENTDDGCMAYMNDGSGWQSQEISVTDVDQYDFSTDMGVYLNGDYGFQAEGKDEVNGAAAYKYTGSITGDEMKDLMLSSGALDSVSRIGLDTS